MKLNRTAALALGAVAAIAAAGAAVATRPIPQGCTHSPEEPCGAESPGALRLRLSFAWRVLRGQPVAYRLEFIDAVIGMVPEDETLTLAQCSFHAREQGGPTLRFFSGVRHQADIAARAKIPDSPAGLE